MQCQRRVTTIHAHPTRGRIIAMDWKAARQRYILAEGIYLPNVPTLRSVPRKCIDTHRVHVLEMPGGTMFTCAFGDGDPMSCFICLYAWEALMVPSTSDISSPRGRAHHCLSHALRHAHRASPDPAASLQPTRPTSFQHSGPDPSLPYAAAHSCHSSHSRTPFSPRSYIRGATIKHTNLSN